MEDQNKKPQNPQAFPLAIPGYCVTQPEEGMKLRDYFAAKAMQAAISHYGFPDRENYKFRDPEEVKSLTEGSFLVADAMLKEREKSKE